jgi:hypothetical protein
MGKFAEAVLGWRSPTPKKEDETSKGKAQDILGVQRMPYFKGLVAQLEAIAHMPVQVGDHAAMIEQIGKQNAYRELLLMFKKDLDTAERVLAQDQARQRGR